MFTNFSLWRKPRLRRRGCRLLVVKRAGTVSLLVAGTVSARYTHADTLNFTGSNGGLFNVAANWSGNKVPTTGDTAIITALTVLLNGITVNPDVITLNNGSTLDFQNSPTLNVGNILFTNTGGNTQASRLSFEGVSGTTVVYTLGSGTTLSGRIGGIGNSAFVDATAVTLNTAATFNANVAGNTTVLGAGGNNVVNTITNTGSINASNGNNLNVNARTFTNSGSITESGGGALSINGTTFTNNSSLTASGGSALTVSTAFTNVIGGNVTQTGGGGLTISGGSFTNAAGATLASDTSLLTLSGGTLINNGTATFANPVNLSSTGTSGLGGSSVLTLNTATVNGTLNLNGANLTASSITLNNGSTLDLFSNTSLNVSNILFTNTGGNTQASRLSFEGVSGTTVVYTLGSGTTLSGRIGGIGNSAFVDATAVTLNTAATFNANVAGNTTVLGAGGNNVVNTITNTGSINASNGNNLNVNARTFTNSGTLTIASGSAATVNSNIFQQTGNASKTIVDGTATLASVFSVQGGTVEGNGTITGNINNTGGVVTAGGDTTAGHLTLTGNYTQGTGGAELVKLGGTGQGSSYDLFSVSNTATLHGTLDVQLLNNFTPFTGETFDFLTYKTRVGAFDSVTALNGVFSYTVTYNDAAGIGTLVVGAAAVPEAGTVVTLSLLLGGAGFMVRRQRRQQGALQI